MFPSSWFVGSSICRTPTDDAVHCSACTEVIKRRSCYNVSADVAMLVEARAAFREAVVAGDKVAMTAWKEMFKNDMDERLALAGLIAKKYGLP